MTSTIFSAKVKSIVSADTVAFDNGTQLSLAYVGGPRLLTEPYGFQAREHLRTLLIGKPAVRYRIHYDINGRNYGDISAPIFSSLIEKSLAEGNVKLRDDAQSRIPFPEIYDKFSQAQDLAKEAELGLWSPASQDATIELLQTVPEELYGDGKAHNAIVERVISGDRFQIRVLLNSHTHILTNAILAGVRTPRSAGGPDGAPAEPFGEAAKTFVESRLLQRPVTAQFFVTSANGLPVVELLHTAGNISVFLLSSGLASIADWQSVHIGATKMAPLRAAEKQAKDAHLNLWKDHVAQPVQQQTATGFSLNKPFHATVFKVVSSDTFVLKLADGKEETVQLTSVRAPRKSDPGHNSAYAPIAKEFARSKFIGKEVTAKVDAIRPKSLQFEERPLVTLTTAEGVNVASFLIENGFATVIRHRKDDNDRSPLWDELLEKETKATEEHKGVHSEGGPPADRTVDASENATRAKTYLTQLSRQNKISGVVDHISSAGRIRITVPRNNLVLTLVYSGVRTVKTAEPFGQEALDFVSNKLFQRDVQFSVNNVDKTGAFIGTLYFPGTNSPVSVELVKDGFAEVHEFSAQSSGYKTELAEAQAEAQAAHLRIWKNFKGEEERAKEEAAAVAVAKAAAEAKGKSAAKNYIDIYVSNVSSTGEVSYRLASKQAQYKKLIADLTSFHNAAANAKHTALTRQLRRGDYVSIVSKKGEFARGKVAVFDKATAIYVVVDVDTGKVGRYQLSSLRALPSQFSTNFFADMAKTVALSFIKLPPAKPTDYLSEYVDALRGQIENQSVVANVDSPSTVTPANVTLFTANSKGPKDSVNSYLIDEGYAFIKPKLTGWEQWEAWKPTLEHLKELQKNAQSDRVGVWEYGDPESDEE